MTKYATFKAARTVRFATPSWRSWSRPRWRRCSRSPAPARQGRARLQDRRSVRVRHLVPAGSRMTFQRLRPTPHRRRHHLQADEGNLPARAARTAIDFDNPKVAPITGEPTPSTPQRRSATRTTGLEARLGHPPQRPGDLLPPHGDPLRERHDLVDGDGEGDQEPLRLLRMGAETASPAGTPTSSADHPDRRRKCHPQEYTLEDWSTRPAPTATYVAHPRVVRHAHAVELPPQREPGSSCPRRTSATFPSTSPWGQGP